MTLTACTGVSYFYVCSTNLCLQHTHSTSPRFAVQTKGNVGFISLRPGMEDETNEQTFSKKLTSSKTGLVIWWSGRVGV